MHIDHVACGSPLRAGITAVASCLPESEITSRHLQEQLVAASGLGLPARMLERVTGIHSRRIVADGEYASTLAVRAARTALERAGLAPCDIDLLVFASATRDVAEPATAHIVQAELGSRAHALDVTNACNSFVNGIDTARAMVLAGRARRALLVTGETPSRAVRHAPSDLEELRDGFAGYTFGDAGAAVVLEAVERGGILDVDTETHSEHWQVEPFLTPYAVDQLARSVVLDVSKAESHGWTARGVLTDYTAAAPAMP